MFGHDKELEKRIEALGKRVEEGRRDFWELTTLIARLLAYLNLEEVRQPNVAIQKLKGKKS